MPSLNQNIIYVSSFVHFLGGLLIMSFASAAINNDPIFEKVWWFTEDGKAFLSTMVCVGILLILCSFLGIFGASSKDKATLLCFYFSSFVLIIFQFVYTGVIFANFEPVELKTTYVPLFKQEWIKLATKASLGNPDSRTTQRASAFLNYTSSVGNCCGFDDTTALEQNPSNLYCTSKISCEATFLLEFRRIVEKQCILIFVMASIEGVCVLLMCGLTIRKKQAPAFTKVKNGVGSIHQLKV